MPSAPEEPPAPVELPPTPLPPIVIPKLVIETKTKKEEPPKPPVVIDKPAPVSPPAPKPTPPPKPVVEKTVVKEKKISKKEIGSSATSTTTEVEKKTVVSTATTTIMRTITTIDGSSVEIAIPPPKMPSLNDLPDIGNEVKEKTEAAKQKRVECAKASAKLAGHKDIIDKTVKELKDETEKKKSRLKECRTETDALRSNISTEMNALMASGADKQKQSDLKKKIKVLELKLEEVNGKCEAEDFDEKKGEKIIADKIAEIKTIVRFIKETCADAAEGESEVEDAIMMVSQIEYTNRVYIQYM
jgi:vacuolar-type H+-ATPase subunit I/STV1